MPLESSAQYRTMPAQINQQLLKSHLPKLLDLADVHDQSFSFYDGGVERRALIGWYTNNAPLDVLGNMAVAWGVPQQFVQQWQRGAEGTEGIGLSINQDLTAIKLYTHKWMGVTLEDVGVPVYRGFKLLADQTLRVDDYVNAGDLRSNGNLAYALALGSQPSWVEALHAAAPQDKPLLFTKTNNTSRNSWLATARYADLQADAVAGPAFGGFPLLHLAGGVDAVKGQFSSIYIQTTLSDVNDFINGNVFALDGVH